MDEALRPIFSTIVAECRHLLEADLGQQLYGHFGIGPDGSRQPLRDLPNLNRQGRANRGEIEKELDRYGAPLPRAVERYVRESAFTVLNRLAALKLMEHPDRKLLPVVVGAKKQSPGFRNFERVSPEVLRYEEDGGYQLFLKFIFDDLASVPALEPLFSRRQPASILFPTETTLDRVLDHLNAETLAPVWDDDETPGWLFQFFTPDEQRRRSHQESQSVPRDEYELAFRNQFFTPRYIVQFLGDNTLGRMWVEMCNGATGLMAFCQYLIRPNAANTDLPASQSGPGRDPQDPRELRAIDIACGSGHFLLYGFDLFEQIYAEAYQHPVTGAKLRADYPEDAEFKKAIPGLILKHNLYGVEIDRRAAQIARLALWLRAQRSLVKVEGKPGLRPPIERINIVVAESLSGEATRFQQFADSITNPIISRLVRQVWDMLQGVGELGVLLKVEKALHEAIAEAQAQPNWQQEAFWPTEPAPQQTELDLAFLADAQFWQTVVPQILDELRRYQYSSDHADQIFAIDAENSLALIELLLKPFDVVWMNPPFGAPTPTGTKYIKNKKKKPYEFSNNDLFAVSVERGLELLRPDGMLGAITSRTGFFITTLRDWREQVVLARSEVLAFADLGSGVLDDAMVETAAYVLKKRITPVEVSSLDKSARTQAATEMEAA